MLHVPLFKTLNLVELKMLLIYITEGSSVCGHMIQGMCAAGVLLWQFGMVTHLKNWSHLEVFFLAWKVFQSFILLPCNTISILV